MKRHDRSLVFAGAQMDADAPGLEDPYKHSLGDCRPSVAFQGQATVPVTGLASWAYRALPPRHERQCRKAPSTIDSPDRLW
jgi:hypothetical protein